MDENPSCQPTLLQRISMFCLLRWTVTVPGDITVQFPSALLSRQFAPVVGGVVIAMVLDVPFTMEAHPDNMTAAAVTAAAQIPNCCHCFRRSQL
jgi:hypothetical protein